jgi:hypothetical protein
MASAGRGPSATSLCGLSPWAVVRGRSGVTVSVGWEQQGGGVGMVRVGVWRPPSLPQQRFLEAYVGGNRVRWWTP